MRTVPTFVICVELCYLPPHNYIPDFAIELCLTGQCHGIKLSPPKNCVVIVSDLFPSFDIVHVSLYRLSTDKLVLNESTFTFQMNRAEFFDGRTQRLCLSLATL